ncbi:MAG: DNA polymerase III subunit beta [Peptococcaceae bacterium BRH_c4b]|nr:MAG: DNA polymerase III subunit beta [Peptococcaceae bacterium BRH_c4b]
MAKLTREEKKAIDKILQHISNVCHDQLVSVILYGSKARGDFTTESDIDLLVLVRNRQNVSRDKIYDFLLDDEIDYSLNFSLSIYEAAEFQRLASINVPFALNVMKEGEVLWTN